MDLQDTSVSSQSAEILNLKNARTSAGPGRSDILHYLNFSSLIQISKGFMERETSENREMEMEMER